MIDCALGKVRLGMLLALGALALWSPPALAQERLNAPDLPDFVIGHQAENAQQAIREEVPSDESVQDWTRMVTTQRYSRSMTRATPTEFIAVVTDGLGRACPGATTSTPVIAQRGGYDTAQFRANCPRLAATGKPETFFMLVIAGRNNLHVKQVAFRRVPTAADVEWGEGFLAAVQLCAEETCAR